MKRKVGARSNAYSFFLCACACACVCRRLFLLSSLLRYVRFFFDCLSTITSAEKLRRSGKARVRFLALRNGIASEHEPFSAKTCLRFWLHYSFGSVLIHYGRKSAQRLSCFEIFFSRFHLSPVFRLIFFLLYSELASLAFYSNFRRKIPNCE